MFLLLYQILQPYMLVISTEEIIAAWQYFPRFHALYASRPNVNPITITTGIGPTGPQTQWLQRPDDFIDPALHEAEPPSTPVPLTASRSFGSDHTNIYEPVTPSPHPPPASQPPASSATCLPKPSTAYRHAIDQLKATVQVVPKKRTVIDVLVDASRYALMFSIIFSLFEQFL
jgi:hypothetical protein